MARILFHMLAEPGHTNPSMKLAKGLVAHGHQVAYHAQRDLEPQLRRNGMEVIPYLPEHFPLGSVPIADVSRIEAERRFRADHRYTLDALREGGEAAREIQSFSPDLAVVDTLAVAYSLAVRRLGVRLANLSIVLPQTQDAGVPPMATAMPWRPGTSGRALAALTWTYRLARRRGRDFANGALGRPTPFSLIRSCPLVFGERPSALDTRTSFLPQLRDTPELVACPPHFDFPRPPRPGRIHVESIDLERTDAGSLPVLDDRPLVFCSMGTQGHRTAGVVAGFLRNVVLALGRDETLRGLVALGSQLTTEALGPVPANVALASRVPQLAALRHAAVMITHGGLGSVKECISHGVPMNVYPLSHDQPGNGARVVHHRLGRIGSAGSATPESILVMLRETIAAPLRTREMRDSFLTFEGEGRGVAFIERLLATRRTNAASSTTAF